MIRAPAFINIPMTIGLITGCVYFWFINNEPGRFIAASFLMMGLAQYGVHAVMDIKDMRKRK